MQMNQLTDTAINCGIGNGEGYVDVNCCFVDYNNLVISNSTNSNYIDDSSDEYKFERDVNFQYKLFSGILLGSIGTVVGVAGYKKIKKRKKC